MKKTIIIYCAVAAFVVMSAVGCTLTYVKVGNATTDKEKVTE